MRRGRWSPPPSMSWRRSPVSASTMRWSRSMAPKRRSWTAARRRSWRRSTRVGLETLDQPRRYIKVLKPVRVAMGDAFGEIRPNARGFRVEAEIEFDHALIGRQSLAIDVQAGYLPPRDRARAHLRLHARRDDACGTRAMRSALRSRTRWSSATTAFSTRRARGFRTSSSATRCSMRSATWRWRAGRCSAPTARCAAATSSIMRCCAALMSDASAWTWVDGEAPRPVRGHADVAGRLAPAFGPEIS